MASFFIFLKIFPDKSFAVWPDALSVQKQTSLNTIQLAYSFIPFSVLLLHCEQASTVSCLVGFFCLFVCFPKYTLVSGTPAWMLRRSVVGPCEQLHGRRISLQQARLWYCCFSALGSVCPGLSLTRWGRTNGSCLRRQPGPRGQHLMPRAVSGSWLTIPGPRRRWGVLSICSFTTSQAMLQHIGFVSSSPTAVLLLFTRQVL